MAIQENLRIERAGFSAILSKVVGVTMVELAGELDLSTASALREVMLQLPLDSAPHVHVDLREVDFLGSDGDRCDGDSLQADPGIRRHILDEL